MAIKKKNLFHIDMLEEMQKKKKKEKRKIWKVSFIS